MKTAGDSQDALESPWGGSRDAPVRLLRRPKGSWESPGRLQGGSREAFATPPVAPRSLPSGSREALGRRQTQSRHFGGFQGGPGATRDPQEPPKNPPRTPQEPLKNPLWRPMSAPIRGHRAPRECLKQEWRSEGCFSKKCTAPRREAHFGGFRVATSTRKMPQSAFGKHGLV